MKHLFTNINEWKPARIFPLTYPGDRPDNSYLIINDKVFLIYLENRNELESAYFFNEGGKKVNVNSFLKKNQVPALSERYAVLAYGANRNPATLDIKFKN